MKPREKIVDCALVGLSTKPEGRTPSFVASLSPLPIGEQLACSRVAAFELWSVGGLGCRLDLFARTEALVNKVLVDEPLQRGLVDLVPF